MQPAEPRDGYNLAASYWIRFRFTTGRRSFGQREMRAVVVVVTNILAHQPLHMTFIQRDHMVEQISAAGADPTLRNAILPGTSEACPFGFDAETLHGSGHFCIEVRCPVENQILRGAIICSIAFSSW